MSKRIDTYTEQLPAAGDAALGTTAGGETRRFFLGPSDTAWTTVTALDNDWTGTVRYIKRAGMVTVNGLVSATAPATSATLITLPSAYRPQVDTQRTVARDGANVRTCDVGTNGNIAIFDGSGPTIRFQLTYPVIT